MSFESIHQRVGHVPYIDPVNARYLVEMIHREQIRDVLELGIAHGTATCYLADAVNASDGSVTAVDLESVKEQFIPSAEDQVAECGLSHRVRFHRMRSGYNWFLHDEIAEQTRDGICQPKYDLCIIDGPKNWTIDSSAFFLVDKLLRPNGWIIFDDYHWTYQSAEKKRDATDGVTHRSLSADERMTPHIQEVFELLVRQHPSYGNLVVWEDADWAMAQKVDQSPKTYTLVYQTRIADRLSRWISRRARKRRMRRHQKAIAAESQNA